MAPSSSPCSCAIGRLPHVLSICDDHFRHHLLPHFPSQTKEFEAVSTRYVAPHWSHAAHLVRGMPAVADNAAAADNASC